jgi:trans-aconitate methyltransferase
MTKTTWDADAYARQFGFVPAYGRDLIGILAPQKGEKILDLGCGTGVLTAELASRGANVTGIDRDASMVALAQKNYPSIPFFEQDAEHLTISGGFDAVFSNAALHWMAVDKVFPQVAEILRPGGRFVAEMGGHRNIAVTEAAIYSALETMGFQRSDFPAPWRFHTIAALASELEKAGFEVRYANLYDRLTPLGEETGGLRGWVTMFGRDYLDRLPVERREEFLKRIEDAARPALFRNGQWMVDYRRQHFVAVKI